MHSAAEASAWNAAEQRHAASDALVDTTGDANREVVEATCWIPARTIEGLAFKAKVSLDHEDNRFEELVISDMDGILAMGGAHA